MEVNWRILYRGSLDSCNYGCPYCPFAKHKNTKEELQYDRECLQKFVKWLTVRNENISLLITPWGEALIRNYYQKAITELSHLPHIKKVVIQTNLSCRTNWLDAVNKETVALWVTYHPFEVSFEKFSQQIHRLIEKNIRFSIGVVGKKEHFKAIAQLKQTFPSQPIWINAYKDEQNYYNNTDIELLTQYDRLFPTNLANYETFGKSCSAGETSFSVNHNGDVFPCHFIQRRIGNLYETNIAKELQPSFCSNKICDCYIGYMNLKQLNLEGQYGDQILERIPLQKK